MVQETLTRKPLPIGLTDRGRIHAVLRSLEQRWAELTRDQRAEARELVDRITAVTRSERVGVAELSRE